MKGHHLKKAWQGMDVGLGPPPVMGAAISEGGEVTGVVRIFNDTRGYGFISAHGLQQDVYFQPPGTVPVSIEAKSFF